MFRFQIMSLIGLIPKFALPKFWQPKILALNWLESKKGANLTKYLTRFWQKILANILACPSFGKANFDIKPIRPYISSKKEDRFYQFQHRNPIGVLFYF